MQKIKCLLFVISILFSLAACSNVNSDMNKENPASEKAQSSIEAETVKKTTSENSGKHNILIAYFSWADNAERNNVDAITSASVTVPGNVAQLATWISEETDGNLFSIRVEEPYPADWDSCLERANEEKAEGVRPELVEHVENMEDYDTIFLGYPNWWYSCPMAVLSFIESEDLAGKQIYLFCSHGTGGLAKSVQDITEALPEGSSVHENVFDVYEEDIKDSRSEVQSWLEEIGY